VIRAVGRCVQTAHAAVTPADPSLLLLLLLGLFVTAFNAQVVLGATLTCSDCASAICSACFAAVPVQYATLDAAVAATVEAYVGTILQLLHKHSLQVFVHSVPPVLPETRHVVHLFNASLEQQLQAAVQAQPELKSLVHFVDLEGVLLQDGECLKLDGSHLHPSYSRHLQDALSCSNG
jgi:hypothetical protein